MKDSCVCVCGIFLVYVVLCTVLSIRQEPQQDVTAQVYCYRANLSELEEALEPQQGLNVDSSRCIFFLASLSLRLRKPAKAESM